MGENQSQILHRAAVLAFPMHGQHKLISEGYRTRDGHLIEWFGRKLAGSGPVAVISRPEPLVLERLRRTDYSTVAPNTAAVTISTLKLPRLTDRRRWWVDSLGAYPRELPQGTPAVVWNPLVALSRSSDALFSDGRKVAFDLLDDWTIHYAFESIRGTVERAYAEMFDKATSVTANAEGTLELAHRFGRTDAVMVPNGVDPERFTTRSKATGASTVGYVGKIGKRLNLPLIVETARALPKVRFVFAGPILDQEYRKPMSECENIELLGDVHYEDVPELLAGFDVGWVPHNVGEGEVGGDVIKTYEYRAAGLPVLSTPIGGVEKRGLNGVTVLPAEKHAAWIEALFANEVRAERIEGVIPLDSRWETKAEFILDSVSLSGAE